MRLKSKPWYEERYKKKRINNKFERIAEAKMTLLKYITDLFLICANY